MPAPEVRGWMAMGEIEPVETPDGLALPWTEIVSFGMDFWSQETIEAALGVDLAQAIPELLRLTALEVHVPAINVLTRSTSAWLRRSASVRVNPSTTSGAMTKTTGREAVLCWPSFRRIL